MHITTGGQAPHLQKVLETRRPPPCQVPLGRADTGQGSWCVGIAKLARSCHGLSARMSKFTVTRLQNPIHLITWNLPLAPQEVAAPHEGQMPSWPLVPFTATLTMCQRNAKPRGSRWYWLL